ncbi:WXG100 family type VII secretion target [Paenibacillus spiritus]|uniref:ESAT-6-like protein n=1 Tax=Paenibacillus spiritus TaxID=2496557 RepID=A0A5J5GBW8_9BACL|nr:MULTISPECIES: WXG100 family type VII secretion target [Paenibacillus]KAA9005450.1 WXG100 family type VII secretion target [Paenibacillus spiritus]
MAGNNLTFSPDQATSVAKSISNKANNADTLIKNLQKEIHAVSGWWQGESQTAFVQQFDGLMPSFNELVKCVENISKNLIQIANIKQQAEQEMASKLRSR